jgi:predicted transcriptional regulator
MNSKSNNESGLITLLADEISCSIMTLTSRKEYSAIQLSHELDTPISTVYRRLKLLEDAKLIQHVKTLIDHSGNLEKYYRCTVRKATVEFIEGELSVKIERLDYKDNLITLWKKLAKPEE